MPPYLDRLENRQAISQLTRPVPKGTKKRNRFATKIQSTEGHKTALEVLDHLDVGVILVDENAMPISMNQAATRTIAEHDGLHMGSRGIFAERSSESDQLRDLITVASDVNQGDFAPKDKACSAMLVSRSDDRRPLAVCVHPLGDGSQGLQGGGVTVALMISDPEQVLNVDPARLTQLYGLTPTESQVAVLMGQGLNPSQVATKLSIAVPTARTHLKRIFSKTGTARQAELVLLLSKQAGNFA